MSDEFDKEAEREKLRQQLAEEEADRQSTQHMSELLLKGATMTNRHCDECGDPIFRHEGREFCPTCGRQVAGQDAEATAADADDSTADAAGDGGTATGPSGRPQSTPGGTPAPTAQPGTGAAPRSSGSGFAGEADLTAAREALARKVTALAHEAEATTDVGRTRKLLAAVREGAEALRALEDQGP